MASDLQQLVYAAYLHDIGKFRQRCGEKSGTHAEWSREFVMEFLHDEMIASLVSAHHNDFSKCPLQWQKLAKIIIEADHLSAGHDRIDRDDNKKGRPTEEALICCFEHISLGKSPKSQSAERVYPLRPLDLSHNQYPVDLNTHLRDNCVADLRILYQKLWKEFENEWRG